MKLKYIIKKQNNNKLIKVLLILIILIVFIIYIINHIIINNNKNENNSNQIEDNKSEEQYFNLFKKVDIIKDKNQFQTLSNNNSSSKVAIIIPFYNHINYLDFTIRSIKAQTFTDYNIIIIDDNSSDWDIRKKLKKLYLDYIENMNITIIFNRLNYGLSKCRNIGIEYTYSEWILPLDSDDLIDSKFLEKSFKYIQLYQDRIKDYDDSNIIVTSNVFRFNNDENDDKIGYINKVDTWKIPKWSSDQLKQNNLLHCTTMFKKSLWSLIGGYDESLWFGWEDWDFWIRADEYFNNKNNIINQMNNNQSLNNKRLIFESNSNLHPIIIDEYLFYYRVKKEGLHSFCKVNYKLCYSLFQTLHPSIYPVEDILLSHLYIGRNGEILKNSLNNQIKKYPNNPINYFWLSLIKQYNSNNLNNYNNIQIIRSLYQKSIELQIKKQYNNSNNNHQNQFYNSLIWQFELHKLLNELDTTNYIQAKKDLTIFFNRYKYLEINDKINRLYNLNL